MSEGENKVKLVQFSAFSDEDGSPSEIRPLDTLLDIPLKLAVELGRASLRVESILEWEPGFVFVLNKLAGEPVDMMVNNQRIARGEVLVLDESFGVRITEIVSEKERLHRLK